MEYRILKREEIEFMRNIDRSETINGIYYFENGELKIKKVFWEMKGFPSGELDHIVERLYILYDNGGVIFGAFDPDNGAIAGITALENKFRGNGKDTMKMDILFVSKPYRGKGIAKKLIDFIKKEVRARGGGKVYVSATESKNTVEFYIYMGCRIVAKSEIDAELFEMEPEDIHMILDVH
ncbi:MAG: GNAT family N-acetyltransferase [Candidatus Moranbacteria bacterium]|nr:GNAT family N-acetyltransferase [Candidatus Moranbacteria bacterium]